MSKTINTRIQNKIDTKANWDTVGKNGFIPLPGELIIYKPETAGKPPKGKIGDGSTTIDNLPFIDDELAKKTDLFSKNYNDLTNKPNIPTVPTNVSAFTNDAGYLTTHQDISGKADINHNHDDKYADTTHKHDDEYDFRGAAAAVKSDLLNGAGAAYDTLKELGDLINENVDAIEALETVATNKADKVHEHTYTNMDVTTQAVGGIAAGTSFNNVPITDLITSLLYPYAKPVISSFSLTPYAGIRKIGTSITLTSASVRVTKKSKTISKVDLCKGSTVLKSLPGGDINSSGTTLTFSGLSDTVSSNTTYTIKVFETGNSTAAASSSASYTFVNPYYYGVIASDATITAALITGLTEDVTTQGSRYYSYTTTSTQCAVIAYPASYGELSQIKDANNFTQTWSRFDININNVPYYVYKSGAAAATNFAYEFSY